MTEDDWPTTADGIQSLLNRMAQVEDLTISPDEFLREMRLAAAMHWCAKGMVSQEKAAEVAGLDRTDFLLALARERVEAFPVDLAQLTEEINRG